MEAPQEIRDKRLQHDLQEMESLRCDAIQWQAVGKPPSTVLVTFKIRSIISVSSNNIPTYRDKHDVIIEIPAGYPLSASPIARMGQGCLPIFHPNFYTSGLICTQAGKWTATETLPIFIIRLAKMFMFDADMTNPASPANRDAARWYVNNLSSGLFPTDNCCLPTLGGEDDDFEFRIDQDSDFEMVMSQ